MMFARGSLPVTLCHGRFSFRHMVPGRELIIASLWFSFRGALNQNDAVDAWP